MINDDDYYYNGDDHEILFLTIEKELRNEFKLILLQFRINISVF